MNTIRNNLRRAREAEPMSKESYQYDSWNLGTIKGMVSYWADLHDHHGEPLNGHQRNNWAKDVLKRIIELDEIFKEDKK
tara:strand:+ start:653 stop:889 length:237 start_codon:yes stop_codon:yes gene_type:complete